MELNYKKDSLKGPEQPISRLILSQLWKEKCHIQMSVSDRCYPDPGDELPPLQSISDAIFPAWRVLPGKLEQYAPGSIIIIYCWKVSGQADRFTQTLKSMTRERNAIRRNSYPI